jgi:hypothetical protein
MPNNRKFQLLFTIVLIVTAVLATISAVEASPPSKADLAFPPRPDFWHLREESQAPSSIPVTGGHEAGHLSDYHQRHLDWGRELEASDYYERHPRLHGSAVPIVEATDYFQPHPELSLRRSREADRARWEAIAEYYQAVAEAQNLARGRAADAARWTAIAEYYK